MYEIYQFWGHDLPVLSEDSSHEADIQDGEILMRLTMRNVKNIHK